MMAGSDVSCGLRDALIENLNNILSPQAEVRRAAEEQIHVLEVTEGERKEERRRKGRKTRRRDARREGREGKDGGMRTC